MTTTTEKKRKASAADVVTASDVLREQDDAKLRALAESRFYRGVVQAAAAGDASTDDIQAGRIIGAKWNWRFDDDLAVLREIRSYDTKYPDGIESAQKTTWEALTAAAAELKAFQESSAQKIKELNIARGEAENRNRQANLAGPRVVELRRKHPHLFEGDD